MFKQDLHIHTLFSSNDSAVVPEQTVAFVAAVKHAAVVGISDHFEYLTGERFIDYEKEVRQAGLRLGAEVDGHSWAAEAADYPLDYYIFHCHDRDADYTALDLLLAAGKPVIIAHPNTLNTNLNRISAACLVEINNRYVWRSDWVAYYGPFVDRFKFVLGSDAHRPHWLNLAVAEHVATQLEIEPYLVFGS